MGVKISQGSCLQIQQSARWISNRCGLTKPQEPYLAWKTIHQMLPINEGISKIDCLELVGKPSIGCRSRIAISQKNFLQPRGNRHIR